MAKFKGKGVVAAGLLAGAASFLSKKENRDKAMEFLNSAKDMASSNEKVQGMLNKATGKTGDTEGKSFNEQQDLEDVASTAADASTEIINGNEFISEGGGQQTVDKFNRDQHES